MRLPESVGTARTAPIGSMHLLLSIASRLTEGQPPSSSLSPATSGEVFVSSVRSLNASSKGQKSGEDMSDTVLQGHRCDDAQRGEEGG
jgi:hypothetical protein